jgi:WD40 repeat protein
MVFTGSQAKYIRGGVIVLTLLICGVRPLTAQLPPSPPKPVSEPEAPPQLENQLTLFQPTDRVFTGQRSTPNSLIFSPDSQFILTGGNSTDPILRVWRVSDGERQAQIRAQRSDVLTMAITPNGNTLITSGADGVVNAWNWNSGQYIGARINHNTHVLSLAISPNGEILVSGSLDGIRVWTLNPRRPFFQLTSIGTPAFSVGINPTDGQTLASGDGEGFVRIWNLQTAVKLSEFTAHSRAVTGVVFSRDGQRIVTSSEDRTLKIWDAQTNKLLHTLIGHTGPVRQMVIHPNGQIIASASNDGVRLWNIASGELLQWIKTPDWANSLAFSPDGKFLGIGSFDFSLALWEMKAVSNTAVNLGESGQ